MRFGINFMLAPQEVAINVTGHIGFISCDDAGYRDGIKGAPLASDPLDM